MAKELIDGKMIFDGAVRIAKGEYLGVKLPDSTLFTYFPGLGMPRGSRRFYNHHQACPGAPRGVAKYATKVVYTSHFYPSSGRR